MRHVPSVQTFRRTSRISVRALAKQFANMDYDVLLYDPESAKNRRGEFVADMVKKSGAQGLVLFMQQFCDPEEMEYPYLKKSSRRCRYPAHQTWC